MHLTNKSCQKKKKEELKEAKNDLLKILWKKELQKKLNEKTKVKKAISNPNSNGIVLVGRYIQDVVKTYFECKVYDSKSKKIE